MSIPRSEYPRPQFVRDDWLCLNGAWQFEMDPGDSGLERTPSHESSQEEYAYRESGPPHAVALQGPGGPTTDHETE